MKDSRASRPFLAYLDELELSEPTPEPVKDQATRRSAEIRTAARVARRSKSPTSDVITTA